jgi:hypothetical protein
MVAYPCCQSIHESDDKARVPIHDERQTLALEPIHSMDARHAADPASTTLWSLLCLGWSEDVAELCRRGLGHSPPLLASVKSCPYSKQIGEQAGYLGVMQLEAIVGVVAWYSACIRGTEGNVTAHKKVVSSRLVVPFLFLSLKLSRVGRGCKGYV